MNLDDLTYGQLKQIAAMFYSTVSGDSEIVTPHIGKKCIVRTYAAGVHYGRVAAQSGQQVELTESRRLWKWDVTGQGISLSEVAVYGPFGPDTRICIAVPAITLLDVIEIIPASDESIEIIEAAEVALSQ